MSNSLFHFIWRTLWFRCNEMRRGRQPQTGWKRNHENDWCGRGWAGNHGPTILPVWLQIYSLEEQRKINFWTTTHLSHLGYLWVMLGRKFLFEVNPRTRSRNKDFFLNQPIENFSSNIFFESLLLNYLQKLQRFQVKYFYRMSSSWNLLLTGRFEYVLKF